MIAIDTKLVPFEFQKRTASKNWQNIFTADAPPPELLSFYQECVDQNLVLNFATSLFPIKDRVLVLSESWMTLDSLLDIDQNFLHIEPWQILIRYYSVDLHKAKLFIQKIEDMSADFSLKKFWYKNKFDFSVEYKTVDFTKEITSYELVNTPNAEIWGLSWPVE